jgi:BASS family bile acid:Na+ symporter
VQGILTVAVPAVTFLVLMAVGLDLTAADFRRVRHQHRIVTAGLVGPLLILPPLAWLLILLFAPPADVRTGLLLIVACPIGGMSNMFSYLARASTALSVTLTACSSLLAVVTIPMLGHLFVAVLGQTVGFVAPLPLILAQLVLMLAWPVAIGMWVRGRRPDLAARWQPSVRALGLGGIAALVALVIASNPAVFVNDLSGTVPLAATFVATSFLAGWAVGGFVGATRADKFTLATEFATRNVAVATAIAVTLAGRVEFAMFATTYFLTEAPLMLAAATVFRRPLQPA